MAYQPLTPQQFQSARSAGFSPAKIIQMEQVRKAQETAPPTPAPTSTTPVADMIPHFSYNENNGATKTIGKAIANIPHEVGGAVETIANVPAAAYHTVTDPNVQAHPLQAVSGALGSLWNSIVEPAMGVGRTIEGGLQAGMQKLTGADIGTQESKDAFDHIGQNATDATNSVRQSLVEHPLATASMAKSLEPVKAATREVLSTGAAVTDPVRTFVAEKLKASAKDSIEKTLAPTTKPNKIIAGKVSTQILERPLKDTLSLTRKGLEEKAAAGKDTAGVAINDYGDIQGATKTSDVINALEDEKAQYSAGGKVVNQGAVDKLTTVQDIIKQYGDSIDNNTLRDVRRIFDAEIQRSKGFQLPPSEGSMIDAKKVASDKIRGILADAHPDLDKLNKEYTFWKNLEGVISDTNKRTTGQSGLTKNLTTLAGAATGHGAIGMAAQALTFRWIGNVVRSTGWRLVSARVKNTLADAIASGDFAKANNTLDALELSSKESSEWKALKATQTPNASQTTQTTTPTQNAVNIPKSIPPKP